MDSKENLQKVKDMINQLLNDYNSNREYSDKLRNLYIKIIEKSDIGFVSYKQSVLKLFIENIYDSFETCLLLHDNNRDIDAYVVGRRIVEILVRAYYLALNNLYEHYYRLKYEEKAAIFRNKLEGMQIETISKTHWWNEREEIVKNNESSYKWRQNQELKKLPNIEQMAENSKLTYLYKQTYGAWSKYVHCNMIIEDKPQAESNLKLEFLRSINACMFLFIKKFSQELNIFEIEILEFKKMNATLTSFDLTTANLQSNVDITIEYFNALFGVTIEKEKDDKEYESIFFNNNAGDFKRNGKSLYDLVKEKESELKEKI